MKLRTLVAKPGASDRAAEHIAAWLRANRRESSSARGSTIGESYHGPHDQGPAKKRPAAFKFECGIDSLARDVRRGIW